jgi:hypothetical protein
MFDDFFSIAALARGKYGHLIYNRMTWHFFNKSHFSEDFLLIIPEKLELSKEEGYNQNDHLVAENKD